jgi:hypothetical protein
MPGAEERCSPTGTTFRHHRYALQLRIPRLGFAVRRRHLDGHLDYGSRASWRRPTPTLLCHVRRFEDVSVRAMQWIFASRPISPISPKIDRTPRHRILAGASGFPRRGLHGQTGADRQAGVHRDAPRTNGSGWNPAIPAGSVSPRPFLIEDLVIASAGGEGRGSALRGRGLRPRLHPRGFRSLVITTLLLHGHYRAG